MNFLIYDSIQILPFFYRQSTISSGITPPGLAVLGQSVVRSLLKANTTLAVHYVCPSVFNPASSFLDRQKSEIT